MEFSEIHSGLKKDSNFSVYKRANILLSKIFKDKKITEPFVIFYNNKKDFGKVYLTMNTSLVGLMKENDIPFKWTAIVRNKDVVIYF